MNARAAKQDLCKVTVRDLVPLRSTKYAGKKYQNIVERVRLTKAKTQKSSDSEIGTFASV